MLREAAHAPVGVEELATSLGLARVVVLGQVPAHVRLLPLLVLVLLPLSLLFAIPGALP